MMEHIFRRWYKAYYLSYKRLVLHLSNEIFIGAANARYFRGYTALCISNQQARGVAHLYVIAPR